MLTPEIVWAQRSSEDDPKKNVIYLTVNVSDVPKEGVKVDLAPTKITYKSTTTKGVEYSFEIEFFKEIDVDSSVINHTAKATEIIIRKKIAEKEYWPRLTKERNRLHNLRTDFDKWVDEDEQDGIVPEPEYDPNMMSQFGGGDDAGGFGGIDFSKLGGAQDLSGLGGMGGIPGMGGPDFGGAGLEDDSDDDEEMPDLEGDEKDAKGVPSEPAVAVGEKPKPVIEELD